MENAGVSECVKVYEYLCESLKAGRRLGSYLADDSPSPLAPGAGVAASGRRS